MNRRDNDSATNITSRTVLLIVSLLFIVLPFSFVSFPPSTDLPQQLGQIHLLAEILEGRTELYSINWFAPNNLVYLLLAASEFLFSPPLSGKIALIILVLLWVGSVFYLSWKRQRPMENAVLAAPFVYNQSLYWGFLNFLIGWPFFVLWLVQSSKPMDKRNWLFMLMLSLFLYGSHALWFLIGSFWLLLYSIIHWKTWKSFVSRMSCIVPIGVLSVVWYTMFSSTLKASYFETVPKWINNPIERLAPEYIVKSMLGGLRGNLEPVVSLIILGWIVLTFLTNRRQIKSKTDKTLLICSLFFAAIMLFAPERFMNTILLSERWFPCAIILLLLGLPAPAINKNLLRAAAITLLIVFSIQTARTWHLFEQKELSGLMDSLSRLPDRQRVLGLDFAKKSELVRGRPFLQMYAYSQVLKGAALNFSFAEHNSLIVRYKEPPEVKWTPLLDWFPEHLNYRDFSFFDYALVNAEVAMHSQLSSLKILDPVTNKGRWRLYRVVHGEKDSQR